MTDDIRTDTDATPRNGDAGSDDTRDGGNASAAEAAKAHESAPARVAVQELPSPPPMNPYLAGLFLGLTLLASYLILGAGLGASGALARLGAWLEHLILPARVEANAYFGPWFPDPLAYYLSFMFLGVLAGGLLSALAGGRLRFMVERGPTASRLRRLLLALAGGALTGFAARLAQGCTSGQGLSGGALLLTGSFVFLGCVFATGYLTAWIFRRQWK
ncbi:hypothetical protein NNJEOMEG_02566 [Fundidesulfovibrio magnetotacticus]|uniref:Sulphur transport domain-containing protein n=1 Tax=Fundidesulfovibrio magnetotacticus TaxID=2730080 RepID=A0A6V8LXC2_9BACT|nr:YeeE/YedE thiosulfate transporter family protein [Fundidesulfovibrio magnetotacticus]GFK94719.1 hypothetical protein NNJEOMEG_02566 [Fundidesulfovibrio magnetotacticus]